MPRIVFIRGRGKNVSTPKRRVSAWYKEDTGRSSKEIPKKNQQNLLKEELSPLVELESLTGLGKVKKIVKELTAYARMQKMRESHALKREPLVLHMVFKGNPGTGKTTVARILGRLLRDIEILPKGHLVEIERADLVGEYIGHTAQKTRLQIQKALGGILFIDEAYSLFRGGDKDFGREAVETLVKATEDHRNELVVILAGYRREMELFMLSNPGLKSRFPLQITFPDYKKEELMQIAEVMAGERDYVLSSSSRQYLSNFLNEVRSSTINFSNARLMRNIIERAIRKQACRLVDTQKPTRSQLMSLEKEDLVLDEEGEDSFISL